MVVHFDNNVSNKYTIGLIDNIMENSNNIFAYMRISTQEERIEKAEDMIKKQRILERSRDYGIEL